jgi:hypothetical protein
MLGESGVPVAVGMKPRGGQTDAGLHVFPLHTVVVDNGRGQDDELCPTVDVVAENHPALGSFGSWNPGGYAVGEGMHQYSEQKWPPQPLPLTHVGEGVDPGVKLIVDLSVLPISAANNTLTLANTELEYASPRSVTHFSSGNVPIGAMVCVPTLWSIDVVVESEPLTEQPVIVSQCLEVDVNVVVVKLFCVVVAEKKLVVVHASAIFVSHSGFSSVVIS